MLVPFDEFNEEYKRRSVRRHADWFKYRYSGRNYFSAGGPMDPHPKAPDDGSWLGPLWWVPLVLFIAGAAFVLWECHALGLL